MEAQNSDVPSKHPFPHLPTHLRPNSVPVIERLTLTGPWFLRMCAVSCLSENTEGHLSYYQVEQPSASGISADDQYLSRAIQESMRETYNDQERYTTLTLEQLARKDKRSVSFVLSMPPF
jgi:hypothetical protein